MMQTIAETGAGFSGASARAHEHLRPATRWWCSAPTEQKQRMLPPLIAGERPRLLRGDRAEHRARTRCKLKTKAVRDGDHYVVCGQKVWISTAQVADKMLLLARTTPIEAVRRRTDGPEPVLHRPRPHARSRCARSRRWAARRSTRTRCSSTACRCRSPTASARKARASSYILHGMNPERILIAAEAVGLGRAALQRAATYAKERIVFDRPIGQNQGIQHPLAPTGWSSRPRNLMVMKAAWLYDQGKPCGAEANAAKYLAAEAVLRRLREGGDHARRHGLRQGVPRRALSARGVDPAHRAGEPAADPVLHRREGAGAAEVVLMALSRRRTGCPRRHEPTALYLFFACGRCRDAARSRRHQGS